jgi:uncharacterized protein YndB with AHSA1/START domain
MSTTHTTEQLGDIVVTRIYDAPRELVFRAWTDPAHIMRWWGPRGHTSPFVSVDLRKGGEFRFSMRAESGGDTWGKGIYQEIVVPERIVYLTYFTDADGTIVSPTHYGISAEHPTEAIVTLTFENLDGKTKFTFRHTLPANFRDRELMRDGLNQMFDKLGKSF